MDETCAGHLCRGGGLVLNPGEKRNVTGDEVDEREETCLFLWNTKLLIQLRVLPLNSVVV